VRGPGRLILAAAAFLSTLVLLADFLPALLPGSALGATTQAVLGRSCHQRSARSFHVDGRPLAACARCCGLHASGLLAAALVFGFPRAMRRLTPLPLLASASVAVVVDAGVGIAFPAWDHPWVRCFTGLAFGAAALMSAWRLAERHGPSTRVGEREADASARWMPA